MLFALIAAAAASLTAAPSHEAEVKPAPIAAAVPPAQAPGLAPAKTVRYCFRNVQEDHIVVGKLCRTRAQWMWHGVDPLDYIGRRK